MHSGIIAAIAIVFARYASLFVPIGEAGQHVLAAAAIGVLTVVNYAGLRHGAAIQTVVTAAKVVAIVALMAAGIAFGPDASAQSFVQSTAAASASGVALAIAAGLFAFGGWHMVTYAAGETVDAGRTIPRALSIGIVIVTLCYAGLNAVYLRVLPLEAVRASSHVAADAADALFGAGGARIVAVLVIVSAFGALNGIILAGPRVYYAMAANGSTFRGLAHVHPRFHTPSRAILLQGAWSAVLAFATSYRTLFMSVVNTEWIFFGLLAIGLLRLRRRAEYRPPYRMPGVPVVPLLFAAASWWIVIAQTLASPRSSVVGLGLVAAGLPVYLLWHAGARRS